MTLEDQIATIKEASRYDIGQQQSLLKAPGKFVDGMQKLADLLTTHKQIDKSPSQVQEIASHIFRFEIGDPRNSRFHQDE